MNDLKKSVILIILANYNSLSEKFNALLKILLESKLSTPSQKRYYNSCGFSKVNLENLEYDIKKIYNITNLDLKNAIVYNPKKKSIKKGLDPVEKSKTAVKLKDEFPFLYQDNCPNEFKILINDKFKAYYDYLQARAELKEAVNNEANLEALEKIAANAVENFELNHLIYQELDYYKEHKEILGKHPIFKNTILQQTVNNYSTIELTNRQKALRTYISRETPKLEAAKDEEKKGKISKKIDVWKIELSLVEERLSKIS